MTGEEDARGAVWEIDFFQSAAQLGTNAPSAREGALREAPTTTWDEEGCLHSTRYAPNAPPFRLTSALPDCWPDVGALRTPTAQMPTSKIGVPTLMAGGYSHAPIM